MAYTNFAVITDTPARLATFLVSRGIIQQDEAGSGKYVGVLPGMEWVEVPNPIVTDNTNPSDPVRDTRHVYLVKFAHDSESQKAQAFDQWLTNNSTVVSAPAGWTVGGEPAGDAYKVNGQNVWIVRDRPERFGTWQ